MERIKKRIISILNKLPYIRTLNKLLKQYESITAYPPGHYYSPIPDVAELLNDANRIFEKKIPEAINLNEAAQLQLFEELLPFYNDFPYNKTSNVEYRFHLPKAFFTFTDALTLYGIIRKFKPQRIIEIGSGYSSALLLDVNQFYFNSSQHLTFIDPDFSRLRKFMRPSDEEKTVLINKRVQEVDPEIFGALVENDLLFIDSSHVSKVGSELNYLIFEILPKLNKGVIIHFHDIYYPFEYPKELVLKDKLAWNEAYLVKAFLMYNTSFKICYFNNFIYENHRALVKEKMPECLIDEGASLYIVKIA